MTDFDVRPSSPPGQFPSCVITDVTPADSIAPRRLVLLLPPRDLATPDAPPLLAERGEIVLAVPPTLEAKDVLVAHARSSDEAEFIGVLRGVVVAPARDRLRFQRYEPFLSPVVSSLGQAQVDGANLPSFLRMFESAFFDVINGAHKVEHPERLATGFTEFLLQNFTKDPAVYKHAFALTRSNGPAHHVYHRRIKQLVIEYLESQQLAQHGYRIDTDGLLREGTARARYTLLGSYTQPATSILSPFACAVDYTIQTDPTTGAELRSGLLDSITHVASGSYDAAVRIVLLRGDTPHSSLSYLALDHVCTRNFLEELKRQRVHLCLVEPRHE
jgi:hypothetical protein